MMSRLALAATALLVVAVAAPVARQQREVFRAGTDLVSVYATVVEKDTGRLVTDLGLLDFEIRDEGQIRPIALFRSDAQPFNAVIMLDRSGSMADHFGLIRDAAAEFIRQMRPDDTARIGSFSDQIVFSPDEFTSDKSALLESLDELQDMGPSPVWTAIDRSMTELQSMPDRRVVLVFTDGHNDVTYGQVNTSLRDVTRRARVNGIMIYAIGFASEISQTTFSSAPRRRPSRPGRPGGFPFPWPRSGIRFGTRHQPPDPGLSDLADISGGGYFEWAPTEDLRATFARVAEELHQQYWIGFHPARLDGKNHDIEVKVRKRGLEVRARKTYLASAPGRR